MLWPLGAVLAAAFAACLPRSAHWPLPSGLGGVIGDVILRLPVLPLHVPVSGMNNIIAAIALGGAALVATAVASGLLWRDAKSDDEEEDEQAADEIEQEDERGWISLGFLTHSILSLRARLGAAVRPAQAHAAAESRNCFRPAHRASLRRVRRYRRQDLSDADETAPPRARKPRTPKLRRSSGGYVLPALELLNPPSKIGRATMSSEILQENARARRRARRFRRPRRTLRGPGRSSRSTNSSRRRG